MTSVLDPVYSVELQIYEGLQPSDIVPVIPAGQSKENKFSCESYTTAT